MATINPLSVVIRGVRASVSASGLNFEQACHCRLRLVVNPFSITSSDSIQSEACASPKPLGFINNPSKAALQTSRHAIFSRLCCRLRPYHPPLCQLFHFFRIHLPQAFPLPSHHLPFNHPHCSQPATVRRIASHRQLYHRVSIKLDGVPHLTRPPFLGAFDPSTATIERAFYPTSLRPPTLPTRLSSINDALYS